MERTAINDYRIVDVLGRGGMGVVYRAVHMPTGAPAAVKTVRTPSESTLESIRREILMLRELQHPNVVAIRDHGVSDGMPWYAMDLLRGRTLRDDFRSWFPEPAPAEAATRDLLGPGRKGSRPSGSGSGEITAEIVPAVRLPSPPYSLGYIVELFRRLCDPLAYVHGQGVIHRDLSPANVFLTDDNQPVLFDFGLAAQFRTDSSREVLEVGGLTRGTPHYMAPEQARGEIVDARADVYALGCLLFEALAGRPPFLAESSMAVLLQHIEEPPPAPSQFAEIPTELDVLVLRMLAKRPRDRIGYVDDVASALDAIAASPITPRVKAKAYTYRASFAGRAEVIEQMERAMKRLAAGSGGAAYFVGESGVGKTRLVSEVAARAREMGVRVVTGECDLHGAPLHPFRPMLQLLLDRCRESGAEEARRLLGDRAAVLAQFEPGLARYVAPGEATAGPVTLHSDAARARVLQCVRETATALASDEPLLIVLDDLQWADELTLALVESGDVGELAQLRIYFLATVRAEERTLDVEQALSSLGATAHHLARLDRAAIGDIVRDMLALDGDAPTLTDFVASRAEGNPLFAAEYVRVAVDEGVLQRDGAGRWKVARRDDNESYDTLPTPDSVQALMRRRLRWLSDDAREVTLAMSVLGRTADPGVLAATAAIGEERTRDAVVELLHKQVIEEMQAPPMPRKRADTKAPAQRTTKLRPIADEEAATRPVIPNPVGSSKQGELRFIHDKLREQAYGQMGANHRTDLHHRAALALEASFQGSAELEQQLGALAHHWEQAGDLRRAAEYLERGAQRDLGSAAFREARALLTKLLALPLESSSAQRARWQRWLGEACYALGDLVACATHTEASLAELGRPLPTTGLGWGRAIARGLAQQVWSRLRPTQGRVPFSVEREPEVTAALAAARMTSCYFFRDDSLGVVGAALSAVNLAERAGTGVPVGEIYGQLGYVAGLARLAPLARMYFAQGKRVAAATSDEIALIKVLSTEAALAVGNADFDLSRALAHDVLVRSQRLRNPQEAEVGLTILGHVAFLVGDYSRARQLATELLVMARARGHQQHESWGIYTEGRADLYAGKPAAAAEAFTRAKPLIATGDDASHVLVDGMSAHAHALTGDLARARDLADATTQRIGTRTPPVFTIAEGFIGAADAYLEVRARTHDASLDPAIGTAIANIERLARVFPIAGPGGALARARHASLLGEARRARKEWARALAVSETLAMPAAIAAARAGLARIR